MNSIARDLAVKALRDRAGNVSARLARLSAREPLSPADRALARELALGVVRRRLTLQSVLRAFLRHPDKKLPAPLEEIFLVGLYQMLFLERVPAFAAVDEAVEQAIRFGHKRQSGLVNGLLRSVSRSLSEPIAVRYDGKVPLATDVVAVSPRLHRRLDRPIFANPDARPAEYLAQAYSLPPALAIRWLERFATLAKAIVPAMHANASPPMIVRVNRLKASVQQVLDSLQADGLAARPHANGLSVVIDGKCELASLAAFRDGWLQVQDPTASAVAIAARPAAGMRVLDFCAAPGTKTTHLAELMDGRGSIVAVDVSRRKLDMIEANCHRLGIDIVQTALAETVGGFEPGSFDLALVDAPCSNTGVLSRRPEARWRFDQARLTALARDQLSLLRAAACMVKPGGRVVYSVCSIEPEECSRLAAAANGRRLRLTREQLASPAGADDPTHWTDGGYYAVFHVRPR